jgi:hypothetical protein
MPTITVEFVRFPGPSEAKIPPFLVLDGSVLLDKDIKGRRHPMPTSDGFDPGHPLPVFLDDQYEQQGIGIARDRAVTWSRVFKATTLIVAATAIGVAVLSGNPVALVADVTASLADNLGLHSGADQPAPTIQATADVQASPPTAQDMPARGEIAAAEPAGQDQTEKSEPPSDALFMQFQAWAADKDAQADVHPVQPVQDAPAQAVQDAPPPVAQNTPPPVAENARRSLRIMQEPRRVRAVHNARAEMRMQNPRKMLRRPQPARVRLAPAQDARARDARAQDARAEAARAQDQPAPAQAPSFLQTFGLRN